MVDQLTSSQIAEFQKVLRECDGFSTEAERNRRLRELADSAVRELLEAAFEEPVSPRNLPSRFRLDNYELTDRLGGGGFGEVWRARRVDSETNDFAIKVIRSEHLRGEATGQFVQLFRDEIERHKVLFHAGIVKLISTGSVVLPGCLEATPYLVMEFWEGQSLPDACRGRTVEEKMQCIIQICQAVQHAHRHGLMHLDLKPENILVAERGGNLWPKVLDFGLARRFRAVQPFDSARFGAGTLPYKAPEQMDAALGGEDFRTDVHALGVILFQVLTDHLPYPVQEGTGAEYKKFILNGPRLGLDAFDKSFDSLLQQICARAMAVERARRYDSPASLAKVLEGWLRSRAARPRRKFLLATALVACLALAVVVVMRNLKPRIQWRPAPIMVKGQTKPFTSEWTDIYMDTENEGWLCGGHEQSVSGEYIGYGTLLHTSDGGRLWEVMASSNFLTDSGTLTCFDDKTWNGIGHIRCVSVIKEIHDDGTWVTNGWAASITGVYFSSDAGSIHGKWTRLTPPPDGPDCYSFFEGLLGQDDFHETLAFGWQGIAHCGRGGQWEVQLTTHQYLISAVCLAQGGDKDYWAVATGGGSSPLERGSNSICGAVFHYVEAVTNWEVVPLRGIALNPKQGLYDIVPLLGSSHEFIVAGDSGLLLRGRQEGTNFVCRKLPSHTDQNLRSLSFDSDQKSLWVVGEKGTILRSGDDGDSWADYPCMDEHGKRVEANLVRLRFIGKTGWIVGLGAVLKCELP